MANYRVNWEIDVDAETPQGAAEEAFSSIADGNTLATCFVVENEEGEKFVVDLDFDERIAIVTDKQTKRVKRYKL